MSNPNPAILECPPSPSIGSETSDVLNLKDDEGWEDAEPEEEQLQIVSLFDDKGFTDVPSMLDYCKQNYNFDFLKIRDESHSDFYDDIKLVNFIRTQVKAGRSVPSAISKSDFEDEKYLKPVFEDDALLFNLDDLPGVPAIESDDPSAQLLARVAELEEELRRSQSQFADYRETVKHTLDDRWNDATADYSKEAKTLSRDDDSHYFTSYSYNDIHEVMLKDTVRTDAYRDFIYGHKHLFAGKTVLDVGCGTGILSMLCAKAGAARVIAVDNSGIIDKARENIFLNGLADNIICLRGKIEEVNLPVDKVDIIVSEWMGYCLLYEAMLDSVIWARDRYLKPDGLMVPSHMNMWIAPISDPEYVNDHVSFWRDVYGFDMKPMQAGIYDDALVLHMPSRTVVTEPHPFLQLSLHTTSVKDLVFKRKWEGTIREDIDSLDGFIIWFDTFFMPSRADIVPESARAEKWAEEGGRGIAFTTGPFSKETHWRQGVLLADSKNGHNNLKKGDIVSGEVEYSVAKDNSRALDIMVSWAIGTESSIQTQTWKMK